MQARRSTTNSLTTLKCRRESERRGDDIDRPSQWPRGVRVEAAVLMSREKPTCGAGYFGGEKVPTNP